MSTLLRALVLALTMVCVAHAEEDNKSWWDTVSDGVADIWDTGDHEVFLPLHTHHLRSKYTREAINSYQEYPPGFGYGRGKFRDNGDWHGIYAFGFQESHFKPSWSAGYSYLTFYRPSEDWRIGGGFTAFLMARPDIGHYIPFPGILPMGAISYKQVSVEASYVPGGFGKGNVIFFWSRFTFDR